MVLRIRAYGSVNISDSNKFYREVKMSSSTRKINTGNRLLVCAFCEHWYDPTFSHIRPCRQDKLMMWWEYDYGVKSICKLRRKDTLSNSVCTNFERKNFK